MGVIKSMFFGKIDEVFGQLVELISKVMLKMRYFVIFFITWEFLFSWLYRIAGVEIKKGDQDDYKKT